jgi:hypothetical protein
MPSLLPLPVAAKCMTLWLTEVSANWSSHPGECGQASHEELVTSHPAELTPQAMAAIVESAAQDHEESQLSPGPGFSES